MTEPQANKPDENKQGVLPSIEEMHEAFYTRDSAYEGIFTVAVKTTGIFCRPTCHAKKPKKDNVRYYATPQEALSHGFRACKLCKPMEPYGETPAWVSDVLKEVSATPDIRLRDYDLKQRGIDPARIRRWFNKHHGMTFQAYLRAGRMNRAFGQIKQGEKVIDSALDSGYDSLSGFNDMFKKTTGFSPSKSRSGAVITITRVMSPLGPMIAGASDKGICLLEFHDRRMLETQLKRLHKHTGAEFLPGEHPLFERLQQQVNEYFDKQRKAFDLPLDVPGTAFQKKSWQALKNIPYGETRSYQQQAIAVGNAKAVRAVARANGDNRLAIIIPCHRVIAKDGTLAGYGGKIWRKEYLINLERSHKG